MKKGEAKVEFFTHLEYLKKEYEAGLVVSKFLYNKAVLEKNIKMTYTQFNKYFNDIFNIKVNKIQNISQNSNTINNDSNTPKKIQKDTLINEPIKAKIGTKETKVFDPLYGKKFNNDDIL